MNRVVSALLATFVTLGTTPAWAQATAQINGTVVDSSGGVLPGVTVTAIQTDTGFRREVVTDETGSYALLNLPIGPYRLEADAVRLPHLRADRHRAAGEQQPGHPDHAAAWRRRGNGVRRSGRAARRDPQPRHRRGRRQRAGRGAAARGPQRDIRSSSSPARRPTPATADQPQHDHRAAALRSPAVSRSPCRTCSTARCTTTCSTASTCRCRSRTRCRSSASRPARRTRRTGGREAARSTSSPSPARTCSTATCSSSRATIASMRPARLPPINQATGEAAA